MAGMPVNKDSGNEYPAGAMGRSSRDGLFRSSGLDFKSNGKAISSEAITLVSDLYRFN